MSPEEIDRRRAAKRFKESLKLLAAFLNNSGIATFVGGFVLPLAAEANLHRGRAIGMLLSALFAHRLAQLSLTLFRSED